MLQDQVACSDKVTVVVGEEASPFFESKSRLAYTSKYFRSMFDGSKPWAEASSNIVHLCIAEARDFKVYSHWLKSRDVRVSSKGGEGSVDVDDDSDEDTNEDDQAIYTELIHAFKLGNILINASFCNAMIDEMEVTEQRTSTKPEVEAVLLAYDLVPKESYLIAHLADIWAWTYDWEKLEEVADRLPKHFLATEFAASMRVREFFTMGKVRYDCMWHEHEEEPNLCRR